MQSERSGGGDLEEITRPSDLGGSDRFRLRRCLGSGGMGVVFEAWDVERQTAVALKLLRDLDAQSLYRFKNEFRSLADLEDEHLVRLGELFFERGRWFFTMELLEGADLLAWVRPDDRLDEPRLRGALRQLALGVQSLHVAGKVHRDIKPSNVLVTPEGRAVLLDFGLVSDVDELRSTADGTAVGTAGYMAPEQACAAPVGPAADWYAVGVVLYEALTGRLPFDGAPLEVLLDKQRYEPTPPRWIAPDAPADLDALCVDLLRTDPAIRPTGPEVLGRLGLGPPPTASSRAPLTPPAHRAPYVGRARELGALRRAFAENRGGAPVTMFVRGESGVGKSSLVRQFLATLAEAPSGRATQHPHLATLPEAPPHPDVLVLSGRCYERETLPYKAFDGIVDAISLHLARLRPRQAAALLPENAPALARLFPVLRRVGPLARAFMPLSASEDPQELRARAFEALRELVVRLTAERPVIIFIDDFQWADADSLALLADLMHPTHAPPIFLLATVRSTGDELAPGASLSDLAARLGVVRDLPLGCLPRDEGRALAALLIERAMPEHGLDAAAGSLKREADGIAEEAGGHPMFIHELVRHLATVGSRAQGIVRLEEALRHRIARLDAPARRLLEVVAIAGTPLAQLVAARAAGVSPAELGKLVSILRVATLARAVGTRGSDRIETYHDRVREAVIASLDPDERRRHHAGLARALEELGTSGLESLLLVRHLEAAGETHRAAQHAVRAARFAREALAFDQSAELLRTAVRLGDPTDPGRAALHRALADALVEAGRGAEAAEQYERAAEDGDAATRLECRRRAAEQLILTGHLERGVATLEAVLGEVGARLPRTPAGALGSVLAHGAFLRLRGQGARLRDESQVAAADLTRLDVYTTVAVGFMLIDPIRAADFQGRALLLALRTGERRHLGRVLAHEAITQAARGPAGLAAAEAMLARSRMLSLECRDRHAGAIAEGARGVVLYLAGRFAEAAQCMRDLELRYVKAGSAGGTFSAWEVETARLFCLFALSKLGAFAELASRLAQYRLDVGRRGDRYGETSYLRGFTLVWLAKDKPDEAERDLARATWTAPEVGFHVQHWYELRARTELALYRGETGDLFANRQVDFTRMRRSLLPRVMMVRTEMCWLRARTALTGAAVAPKSERAALVAEARRMARKLERENVPVASAWAALLRGAIAVRTGDIGAAIVALDRAIATAESLQMGVVAACAHRRRGALVGGDEGAVEVARADAAMRLEGVACPERLCEVVAPGF